MFFKYNVIDKYHVYSDNNKIDIMRIFIEEIFFISSHLYYLNFQLCTCFFYKKKDINL